MCHFPIEFAVWLLNLSEVSRNISKNYNKKVSFKPIGQGSIFVTSNLGEDHTT